jgi:tyrosyl-tRNA synthetase
MTLSLRQELEFRWFLNQHTSEDFFDDFDKGWQAFYIWADPSASSLTIWNFVWLLFAMQFLKRWNKMYFIIWWATWMIWDPGWKNSERTFLDQDTLKKNIDSIKTQISGILNHFSVLLWKKLDFEIIDNYDFYKDFLFIDFLRDVWKYMTVNQMIHRDTVKKRIFEPDQSISYTELHYIFRWVWGNHNLASTYN